MKKIIIKIFLILVLIIGNCAMAQENIIDVLDTTSVESSDNHDINGIMGILEDADLVCYSDWGSCHTLVELEMTYYDENGVAKEISFEKIHKEFEGMTYKEICDKINSL